MLQTVLIKSIIDISSIIHFTGISKTVFKHDESTAPSYKALFLHQGHCMAHRHVVRAEPVSGHAMT